MVGHISACYRDDLSSPVTKYNVQKGLFKLSMNFFIMIKRISYLDFTYNMH